MYRFDQVYFTLQSKALTTFYRPNGEWSLVDTAAVYRVQDGYPTARFIIYMTRKPAHFIYTLIFPCLILSLLMSLVFLLPPESGEKISYQITILLSFTVFQLVLRTSMPQTSDFIPFIGMKSGFTYNFHIPQLKLNHLNSLVVVPVQWQRQGFFIWACSPGVWRRKSSCGIQGRNPAVGGRKLKQLVDIVYRFWLQKRSKFDSWPVCFTVGANRLYNILRGLSRLAHKSMTDTATIPTDLSGGQEQVIILLRHVIRFCSTHTLLRSL